MQYSQEMEQIESELSYSNARSNTPNEFQANTFMNLKTYG